MYKIEVPVDILSTRRNGAREQALGQLGSWWGSRLVARAEEVKKLPYFKDVSPSVNIHGWVALVAHWCGSEESKASIRELGGVIGHPAFYSVSHGHDAVDQINVAIGKKWGTYGKKHDGLSIFYLHKLLPEDNEVCESLEAAESPGPLYNLSSYSRHDPSYYKGELMQRLSGPWETLTTDITSNPSNLRVKLRSTGLLRNICLDTDDDSFVNYLRRLEDGYRIATV